MAEIRPFRGLRYDSQKAGAIETLTCPPYDIISETERQAFLENNPHNVIRLELPHGENPYETAGETFNSWLHDGILTEDMDEGFYLYEATFLSGVTDGEEKKMQGIICRVRLEEFENEIILPHEETLSKAKADRFELMKATKSNFSQIFSIYQDDKKITEQRIENLIQKTEPRYSFDDGLVTHRFWVINDTVTISAISEDFKSRKLYIADGHHRYETALNFRDYCRDNHIYAPDSKYVMMFLADMDGLVVFPTHRLVHGLSQFDADEVLDQCSKYFDITLLSSHKQIEDKLRNAMKAQKKVIGFCSKGKFALLELKQNEIMQEILPDMSTEYQMLDVSILHSLILEKIFHIDKENMTNQTNLRYTRSFDEVCESVDRGESNCGFILNPTSVSEISAVSLHKEKMPQKSTYFYPKLITGLVLNHFGES